MTGPGGAYVETCTGGASGVGQVLLLAGFVLLLVAPFATTFYLARRMRRAPAA